MLDKETPASNCLRTTDKNTLFHPDEFKDRCLGVFARSKNLLTKRANVGVARNNSFPVRAESGPSAFVLRQFIGWNQFSVSSEFFHVHFSLLLMNDFCTH